MKNRLWVALASSLILVGCGGGGDDDAVDSGVAFIDASGTIDSGPTFDAPPAACTAAVNYAAGPATTAGYYVCGDGSAACASFDPAASDTILMGGLLNSDALPDALQLELYDGYGVFADGIVAGTYDLTIASEANYATCGACIRIYTDTDSSGNGVDDYYQTAGSLVITGFTTGDASTPSTITGSISGLALEHVTINSSTYESTAVGDCETTVADFSYTANLTDYAAK